ncbi:MAG: hypothetical protein J6V73_02295 [Spirochaetaceae bacterium]|nr:hypothetical protein [Spirochaetaceae bacterium]
MALIILRTKAIMTLKNPDIPFPGSKPTKKHVNITTTKFIGNNRFAFAKVKAKAFL